MHPAPSIILFTVTSGAGYGLLFLFSVLAALGLLSPDRTFGAVTLFVALGLASIGLMSSTFHLKHPERAWRALSQWRSSWLSREGVAAIVTFVPSGLWFLALAFDMPLGAWAPVLAILSAIGAVVVVSCTAMIYGSLKTIQRWHHPLVLPVYYLLALATGGLLLLTLVSGFGAFNLALWGICAAAIAAAWGVKFLYWQQIDDADSASTPSTATGLEGRITLSDPPHTEENYLLKEMGFRVARKHAAKLRRLAVLFGAIVPVSLLLIALLLPVLASVAIAVAAATTLLGTAIERWLFFAEAKHTVMLYYGAQAA